MVWTEERRMGKEEEGKKKKAIYKGPARFIGIPPKIEFARGFSNSGGGENLIEVLSVSFESCKKGLWVV